MAVNFDAVLRLVAKVDGLEQLDKVKSVIGGVEGAAKDARKAFMNVAGSATWQAAAVGAAAIGAGLVASVRVAMDFEKSMSAVAAKTRAGEQDMAKLTQQAKDLGRATQFSAKEVADGMDFLAMAGFKVNDILAAMPGLLDLAAAGNLDLATAADIASNILGGMGMQADEVGRVADVLAKAATTSNVNVQMLGETFKYVAPVAKQAGIGLEEVAAAAGLLGDAGIQGSEAGTALRAMITRLAAPPKEAAKALETLGVSTKDAAGNMLPFEQILRQVDAAMVAANMGSADRLEIQKALFGQEALAAGALLQTAAASGQLSQKTTELMNSQGAAAEMAATMNDNVAGAFTRLRSAIEGFQIQLVQGANPALKGLIDGLANAINLVTDLMTRFPVATSIVVAFTAALAGLVLAMPFIAATISVLGSLKAALAAVSFGAVVTGWLSAIGPALAGIIAAFKVAAAGILAVVTGPVGLTVLLIAGIVAMAIAFREPIMNFFGWFVETARNGIGGFRDAWLTGWNGVLDFIRGVFSTIATLLYDNTVGRWLTVGQALLSAFQGTWASVRSAAGAFFAWLGNRWASISTAVSTALAPIGTVFLTAFDAVKNFLTGWFGWWGQFAYKMLIEPFVVFGPALVQLIGNAFRAVAFAFNQYVSQPIRTAWQAVMAFLGQAVNNARASIQAAWTAVTAAFQSGVVRPVQSAWQSLMGFLGTTIRTATSAISTAWGQLATAFNQYVITPVQSGWNRVVGVIQSTAAGVVNGVREAWQGLADFFRTAVVEPIRRVWEGMMTFMPELVNRAATALQGAFQSIAAGVRGAFQGVVNSIGGVINNVIGMINRLIDGINKVRAAANLSAITKIPSVNIPAFAQGGVVDRATLALIGEGGEREYVIPESKMAAASSRYLGGARGDAVMASGASTAGPAAAPVINITTGPVMEMDGKRYVTIEEYQRGIRQTASQIYATLRTPQGRRAVGYA